MRFGIVQRAFPTKGMCGKRLAGGFESECGCLRRNRRVSGRLMRFRFHRDGRLCNLANHPYRAEIRQQSRALVSDALGRLTSVSDAVGNLLSRADARYANVRL